MSDHWLYHIVPASRPRLYDPRIVLWALTGNDEDGIFGERSGAPTYKDVPPSVWQFVRWNARNPFHNICFHVLNWPGGPIFRWGKRPGWNGYIGWRPRPDGNGVLGVKLVHEKN